MRDVLDGIGPGVPAVMGGDWNTTTYNSSTATDAILGFLGAGVHGTGQRDPQSLSAPLQQVREGVCSPCSRSAASTTAAANSIGERTTSYDVDDAKTHKNLREWVPGWCFAFIRWALRNHDGKCPLKIDWFATRNVDCENPRVAHDVREGRATPLSDHDAIAVDVVVRRILATQQSRARKGARTS